MRVHGRYGSILLMLGFALVACSHPDPDASGLQPKAGMQFRIASYTAHPGWRRAFDANRHAPVYISPDIIVGARDIASLRYQGCASADQCTFTVTLTSGGGKRMMQATGSHIGQSVVMLLDDKMQTVGMIFAPFGRTFQVGGGSEQQTRALLKHMAR